MTMFWIVAALFMLGAVLLLLPGLLRPAAGGPSGGVANLAVHRDQWREAQQELAGGLLSPERFAEARSDIERRVLEEADEAEEAADADPAASAAAPAAALEPAFQPARRTAWALALLIPLGSGLLYLQLGDPQATAPQVAAGDRHSLQAEQIQRMVAALAERLKAQPADAEGWQMLGRSYTALGRYRDAATALQKAVALLPPDASLLADLADVTGMAQGKRLAGEPAQLVQRALDIDPRHVKALALAGSVAFEGKDFANARQYWQRLLAVLPPESPMARSVQGSILEATQAESGAPPARMAAAPRAGADALAPAASTPATPSAAASGLDATAVTGQVQLLPALAGRLAPGDTLFVFARAAQGPRMPLAVQRVPAGAAPQRFRLDDSMAMSPQFKLSGQAQVVIGARISRSGQAMPQPGDLVGESAPVAPGTKDLQLVIDRVQP